MHIIWNELDQVKIIGLQILEIMLLHQNQKVINIHIREKYTSST